MHIDRTNPVAARLEDRDEGENVVKERHATAAVVGAGDYIGAEIAKKFAAEGFTIFAATDMRAAD